jgi:hypothetical protein
MSLVVLMTLVARQSSLLVAYHRVLFPSGARPLLILAVVAACAVAAGDAMGCPNCKDAVNTSDPEGLNVARGYFYSILIMLAMPCTLISSFGIYVWREMQRQKRAGLPLADDGISASPTAALYDRPSSEPNTIPHP